MPKIVVAAMRRIAMKPYPDEHSAVRATDFNRVSAPNGNAIAGASQAALLWLSSTYRNLGDLFLRGKSSRKHPSCSTNHAAESARH
jgi:hypothetical protein